jgi:hypothetical protein
MITPPGTTPAIIQTGLLDRVILLSKKMDSKIHRPREELIKINAEYSRLLSQMNKETFDKLVEYETKEMENLIRFKSTKPLIYLGFNG